MKYGNIQGTAADLSQFNNNSPYSPLNKTNIGALMANMNNVSAAGSGGSYMMG